MAQHITANVHDEWRGIYTGVMVDCCLNKKEQNEENKMIKITINNPGCMTCTHKSKGNYCELLEMEIDKGKICSSYKVSPKLQEELAKKEVLKQVKYRNVSKADKVTIETGEYNHMLRNGN